MSTPRQFVLAIDFDDTIVVGAWPEVGALKEGAREALTQLFKQGHYIIINTCRSGVAEVNAANFLIENQVPFHSINANAPHIIELYKGDCRKMYADIYVDDKNLGGLPTDWKDIYNIIQMHLDYLRKKEAA